MNINNKDFPFYDYLNESEKAMFEKALSVQILEKGTVVKGYDAKSFGPFLVVEGRVREYLHNDKFRQVFLYSLNAGDLCILSASRAIVSILFEAELKAEENTLIYKLDPMIFKQIMDNNVEVRAFIYETLVERFSVFVDNIKTILFDSIDTRLAKFLLEEYTRVGSTTIVTTQDEMAKNMSSSKEVVGRAIRKLASKGLITYEKGKATLVDIDKLQKL